MRDRYFKKFWNESTGDDVTNSWGSLTFYFETDHNLIVKKQIQLFENGKILKYDNIHFEDEYGFLTDQPLEESEFIEDEITKIEFDEILAQ